jgi:hypothetical protein
MWLIFFEFGKALAKFSEQAVEVGLCHDASLGVYVELSNMVK